MKNFLKASVTALALVAGLVMPVAAETTTLEESDDWTNHEIPVTVTVIPNSGGIVHCVEIEWEDPSFTYDAPDAEWLPNNHMITGDPANAEGIWDKTSATVTIKNHSNTALDIKAEVIAGTPIEGITVGVSQNTLSLPICPESTDFPNVSKAPETSFDITVSGEPENFNIAANAQEVAKVKLTISDAE